MEFLKKIINKIINWTVITIGKIHWTYKNGLTDTELDMLRSYLRDNYYIIVTHRNNHLSTYFVSLVSFLLSGKWSYWAHTLLNIEGSVNSDNDFKLIESTGTGVHFSNFSDTFQVHGVALLKPRSMAIEEWTIVMTKAISELGKPYDTLFNINNDDALSCVELVRTSLMAEPDYEINFVNFEKMIKTEKNLTPQMFYDCPDFEIVWEKRH